MIYTNLTQLHERKIVAPSVSTKIYNYGFYPLIKGDLSPILPLHNETFISIQHFLDLQEPLVIVFYTAVDNNYANTLQQITYLQEQVQLNGGNLIIVTNHISKVFKRAVATLNISYVFYDNNNELAEAFGLYDIENPISNWLSGVDEVNASLPAIYVINPNRQIVHHYVDFEFQLFKVNTVFNNVLSAVVDAVSDIHQSFTLLKVRFNKLVS